MDHCLQVLCSIAALWHTELEVIRMPESGYTTEYLKAVIHTAKLYIRPLQTDLSVEPSGADVS